MTTKNNKVLLYNMVHKLVARCIQWVKKPSQCFNVLERLACRKVNKLDNNLKIIYVIE